VEGNDRRPATEDRPAAPTVHGRDSSRLCADLATEI